MMGLSDTIYDKERRKHLYRCQQFKTTEHLPDCHFGNQQTVKTEPIQEGPRCHKSANKAWTSDPIIFEESKYRSLDTFSGDIFPLHFYQWRREILCLILDNPPDSQVLFMLTHLEGEARSKLLEAPPRNLKSKC